MPAKGGDGSAGSELLAAIGAGDISTLDEGFGLLVTCLFRCVDVDQDPRSMWSYEGSGTIGAVSNPPSIGMRAAGDRVGVQIKDVSGANIFGGTTTVQSPDMTSAIGSVSRATAFVQRVNGLVQCFVWHDAATVASRTQSAGDTTGLEAGLANLVIGDGFSTVWNADLEVWDFAEGWGLTYEQAEYVHAFLYNGGTHRSFRALPIEQYFRRAYTLDRVAADELIEDGDAELADLFGGAALVNNGDSSTPVWSNGSLGFTTPIPPSVGINEEVANTEIETGSAAEVLSDLSIYWFENGELTVTITIADPSKVSISDEAATNAGLTAQGGGVWVATGFYAVLQARLRGLLVTGLEAGSSLLTLEVDDGVNTPTITRTLRVIDPDISIAPITVGLDECTIDFDSVFGTPTPVGETRELTFWLRNVLGGPQPVRLDSIVMDSGDDFAIVDAPEAGEVIPYGRPEAAINEVPVTVSFTPSGAGAAAGVVTVTTTNEGDPAYENASNSPYTINLIGTGFAPDVEVDAPPMVCVPLVAGTPFEDGLGGAPWVGAEQAATDDDQYAQASLSPTGTLSTRKLCFPFHTTGNLPENLTIRSLPFLIHAFKAGEGAARLHSVRLVCPNTGYDSGNLVKSATLLGTAFESARTRNAAAASEKPRGRDFNGSELLPDESKPRFEVVFSIPANETNDAEVYVDASALPDRLCVGGNDLRNRGRRVPPNTRALE